MVDAFPIGSLLAPNLTLGEGSRTTAFKPRDWDRIVRHGVLQDGHPAVMPSEDFQSMTDQELSDIVSYIRSLPPVNNTVPRSTFGPLGKILVATGQMKFSATVIPNHPEPHAARPPEAASAEFGKHLAGVHGMPRPDYSGGRYGGDPAWPPAQPHARRDRSERVDLRSVHHGAVEQPAPDGTAPGPDDPLALVRKNMTDVERRALGVPAVAAAGQQGDRRRNREGPGGLGPGVSGSDVTNR
jgi:hypothetical protein